MKNFSPIYYNLTEMCKIGNQTLYNSAIDLTREQLESIFTQAEIEAGEKRGESKTVGMWHIIKSFSAVAIDKTNQIIYGMRTLQDVKELCYDLEGRVNIGGKRYRAFTSSIIFNCEGKLYSCAILYVCTDQPR